MEKDPIIFDHTGSPTKKEGNNEDAHLPPGIQALVEVRLNTAIDKLRDLNRADLKDLARYWKITTLIISLILATMAFYAPGKIIDWIGNQVDKKLIEPKIQESADRIIEGKVNTFIDEKLKPLNEHADALENKIEKIQNDFAIKQEAIEQQQNIIINQQRIMTLAILSKSGSRQSYNTLMGLDELEPESKSLLDASLKEIKHYYDADRTQVIFPILAKKETMKDPGFAVDEVIYMMKNEPQNAAFAVNTLSKLKSKATIGELCKLIKNTEDLRVAARATRAIQEITGERIRPLDFEKVEKLWNENLNNPDYLGNYDGYCYVAKNMWETPVPFAKLEEFILKLDETIPSDENALHSCCLKAGFLAILGKIGGAKALIEIVRKKKSDFRWLYVWEAAIKIKENDIDAAVNLINNAFSKSPTSDVVITVKFWNIFDAVESNERVKWPTIDIDDVNR